ncbi:malto-oligosyltrehalose trehalohydrolase [Lignipirellula cremea]|uniref:Malto-oligosyltrehalose trehalohydrolase n=1 Tax=Lignipirellula cremea TaxID=2528010 RepID=A0A518DM25_9BACT|nr:malto-oligosyltrehalose trehalohydrolase [Lignipirellula cremea]QDU92873.1 Malto-oligosyltrehalose trehalohydrolase [Lignipirellula cremea]
MSSDATSADPDGRSLFSHRRLGAVPQADGSTCFRIWAPVLPALQLEIFQTNGDPSNFPMTRTDDGFYTAVVPDCPAGTLYRYRLPSGDCRPDPASRFQPQGVHAWSQVVDPQAYSWNDSDWQGVAKTDLILYELHVGCFTEEGTYLAACDRLDELVELGVTAIELMPLAQAPGQWNWGYDGVSLFAPNHAFGSPDDFRRLVDAAHQRGLAVLLDVVYNHFGPEGNYAGEFGPYLSDRHSTPWGSAPNFDGDACEPVRDLIVGNAVYWIDEFHLDGLRLDAIHCMADDSMSHVATAFAQAFARLQTHVSRPLHLIAESNVYDPELLHPLDGGGHGYDALWADDFLHSVFALLCPGDHMSSREYHPHTDMDLTLRRGFVFQGTLHEARRRIPLAETADLPPTSLESLVFAIQNHDFIGNHPQGRRLHQIASADAQQAAAALLLLHPAIPMLFMGEEFACEHPFFFFTDFQDPRLREAVEQGRRREHPQHDWTDVESPLSPAAFERSRIGSAAEGNAAMRAWYQQLLALRRQWRSDGLLSGDQLSGEWNQEHDYAQLIYGSGADARFVLVRLHPAGEFPSRMRVTVEGQVLLQHHCETTPEGDALLLGDHGVLVGRGVVTVKPA